MFEVATTQVGEFEVNVMARCSTSAEDKYVCGFNVLMPSMLIIFSLQAVKQGGYDIPEERSAGGRSGWSSMNVGKAIGDSGKSLPKLDHAFASRWLRCRLHELFKVPSICVFEDNIVGVLINKASVVRDDERNGPIVVSEVHEGVVFGLVLFFGIRAPVCLEDKCIPEARWTLLAQGQWFEKITWVDSKCTGIFQRCGTNLLYSSSTTIL